MELKTKIRSGGFIQMIILLIIALAILKIVFNFDIIDFIKRPDIWSFLQKMWDFVLTLWNGSLGKIFWFAWNNGKIILTHAWEIANRLLDMLAGFLDKTGGTNPS